jgi:hypothetical protein
MYLYCTRIVDDVLCLYALYYKQRYSKRLATKLRGREQLFGDADVLTRPYSTCTRIGEVNKWLCEILARVLEFVRWRWWRWYYCYTVQRDERLMFLKTLFCKVMRFEWPWKMCALLKRVDEQPARCNTRPQQTYSACECTWAVCVCLYMYLRVCV